MSADFEEQDHYLNMAVRLAQEMFPGQPDGFPFADFDLMQVKMPRGMDLGIPSDDELSDDEELREESGFGSVIVIDNCPIVDTEKFERLERVLKKTFGGVGTIRENGYQMPFAKDADKTKGYCFIEFEHPEEARAAVELGDGFKLGKHVLSVCLFDDFERYEKVPEEYEEPALPEYKEKENLFDFMLDEKARDQFVIRYQDETEIYWNDGKKAQNVEVYRRTNMTQSFVQWSSKGSYLATVHRQGIAIWGGPSFKQLQKFMHPGVSRIDFSPNEQYLVTYSQIKDREGNPECVIRIFDVRNGKALRTFQGPPEEYAIGAMGSRPTRDDLGWPIFKWAGGDDDLFFAKLGYGKQNKPVISVFTCPDMGLLEKKSLKMEAVQDFQFSPSEPIMCIYQRENGEMPARISLVRVPERTELRQKNLFKVNDVQMYWHPQGDYLAVKVDLHTKTKKSTYTTFELFRVREKDIPMEVMELPNKSEKIVTFAWEPNAHRFVVVHGDGPRYTVSLYTMKPEKGKNAVKLVNSLKDKQVNAVFWSPKGKNLVLAGLKPMQGLLEFFNADEFETLAQREHFMCGDVMWDPSGRYVATDVTAVYQMDNGFQIWTFQGKPLYRVPQDNFFQFSWRPRPVSFLPEEKRKEIQKNLKKYIEKYDNEDKKHMERDNLEVLEKRNQLITQWKQWQESRRSFMEETESFRKKMLGDRYSEAEYTLKEVTLKETISLQEEPYKDEFVA